MEWFHKVNLDWLRERQKYISASEVAKLNPKTPSGRERKVTDLNRLKFLAAKLKILEDADTVSTGAAARGHLLEPYAIAEYNDWMEERGTPDLKVFHWDDALVHYGCAGFSPDAMNIEQPDDGKVSYPAEDLAPTHIVEVKSYGADHHLEAMFTDANELEERWQIAMAMHICPTIKSAGLLLYNPGMENPELRMAVKGYNRTSLAKELSVVSDIVNEWTDFMERFRTNTMHLPYPASTYNGCKDEEVIISELVQAQHLDPM